MKIRKPPTPAEAAAVLAVGLRAEVTGTPTLPKLALPYGRIRVLELRPVAIGGLEFLEISGDAQEDFLTRKTSFILALDEVTPELGHELWLWVYQRTTIPALFVPMRGQARRRYSERAWTAQTNESGLLLP